MNHMHSIKSLFEKGEFIIEISRQVFITRKWNANRTEPNRLARGSELRRAVLVAIGASRGRRR